MEYQYYAFISYNSHDYKWGKRLQRKLEGYRIPAALCSERGWKRKPINPVFFAPSDILPGALSEELKQRLRASRHLIVVCSPNSAQSIWVGQEIEYFASLGRTENIHFFIVDGTPHSGDATTECFNPIIEKLGLPETLGANIHERVSRWAWVNRERAYVQIIAKLLGVEFDSIWQRHRRLLREKIAAWGIGAALSIGATVAWGIAVQPFNAVVSLHEVTAHSASLPPLHNATVTLMLNNEAQTDTIVKIDDCATFTNIPSNLMGKAVKVRFECENWQTSDTTITLNKAITLNVARDVMAFGHVRFTLYDQRTFPVPNIPICIAGFEYRSDAHGVVDAIIPIDKQQTTYRLTSSAVTLADTVIDAKCGESDAIFIK